MSKPTDTEKCAELLGGRPCGYPQGHAIHQDGHKHSNLCDCHPYVPPATQQTEVGRIHYVGPPWERKRKARR
jgi:hypothetical protein